ncbi:hypothetical protein JOM56_010122 [Amanita muscaria]
MNPALSDINGVMRVERFKLRLRPSHLAADKRAEIEKLWSPPEPADEELDDYEEYLEEPEDEDNLNIILEIEGTGAEVSLITRAPALRTLLDFLPPPSSFGHAYKAGEDTTTPSSPAPSVITVSTGETFSTPLEYTVRCVKDVFNQKAPDFHRAQALYTVFTEIASELETTSHFNAVMTRIAENLESLGCKKQPYSSSTKQLKHKRFKSSMKRKPIKTEDTCAILATQYGSEPEMDSDGFFPNPTYGLREAFDDFMKEDPNDNSLVMDREILQFDREYPFADQSYETPQVISLPTVPFTPVAPLPFNTTLLQPKVALPRARTEPPLPTTVKTSIPLRAQTAPPEVSRNTITARRCTNKDASPSSFVKFMDVPVTMTREHIHDCLKNNRKWSTVDISNVEIFAIKNKDLTVVNVLKIKFKDDASSTTAKKEMPTMVSFYEIQLGPDASNIASKTSDQHRTNNDKQQRQGNNDDNTLVTSLDNNSVNNGQSP